MYEIIQIDEEVTKKEREHLTRKAFVPIMSKEKAAKWAEGELFRNHAIFAAKTESQIAAMICLKSPIENRIRGANLSFGGIGDVSTLPDHRRERLIRKIFEKVFGYMNETDIVYSALGPFSYPFYEKFGYAHAEQKVTYEFPGTQIKKMRGDSSIVMREYREVDAEHVLEVQRSMARFGSRMFLPAEKLSGGHPYVLEQMGKVVGFVRFSFKRFGNDEVKMIISHTFFTHDEVIPAIVDLVYRFGSQVKTIVWTVDPEILLEYVLKEPGQAKRTRRGYKMVRVVKFKEFCQQIKVPLFAVEPVILQLNDENCAWNNGIFKLTPVSGRLEIYESDQTPEITMNALQLSHTIGGLMTANRLRRMGGLNCSISASERFTHIFPPDSCVSYVEF